MENSRLMKEPMITRCSCRIEQVWPNFLQAHYPFCHLARWPSFVEFVPGSFQFGCDIDADIKRNVKRYLIRLKVSETKNIFRPPGLNDTILEADSSLTYRPTSSV